MVLKANARVSGGVAVRGKGIYMQINYEQMCCYHCGYIAPLDDPYDAVPMDDGDEYPVCPRCGLDNCGGYPSFAPAGLWSAGDMADIISHHKA